MSEIKKIWDPLRKKEVALTPEEQVRQWFITVLRDVCNVPEHMMSSEVPMSFGVSGKSFRADIVVYGCGLKPLAVVECKRPDVNLSRAVLEQALKYNIVQDVSCIFITNGQSTMVFKRGDGNAWTALDALPEYGDM